MQVAPAPTQRKRALSDAVSAALHNAFSDPEARKSLTAATSKCFDTEEKAELENLLSNVSNVLEQSVQAHVNDWTAQRGLDQAFEVIDEQCLLSASPLRNDGSTSTFTKPSCSLPSTSYAQVRMKCKKEQLDVLRKDLESRTSQVEELNTQLKQELEAATAISATMGDLIPNSGADL